MSQVKLGDYLFLRLAQLGIKTIFGVPGDYELALLDLIGDAGINFSGNANELIASYAADGYARINGAGALVTTLGPGELSAYCGHAGAYTEFVPIVHIVGYPGVSAMANRTLMHHTLGTGEFDIYRKMAEQISVDTAVLTDINTAVADVDRCLNKMLYESRPVYIGVPVDMSHRLVDSSGLQKPLQIKLPPSDPHLQEQVVAKIVARIRDASHPVIIIDGNTVRNNLTTQAEKLAQVTGWPYFTTCMGKGGPSEKHANYGGVYQGAGSTPEIQKSIEDHADLVFWLGSYRSDFNTGEMTDNVAEEKIIDMQRFFVKIGTETYKVGIAGVLTALLAKIEQGVAHSRGSAMVTWEPYPPPAGVVELRRTEQPLTQDYLWDTLGSFFRSGDIIVGETGTSSFGLTASRYPQGCSGYNQTTFGSIGYAGPSAVGAFQAAKEAGTLGRGILITGEGSLQLTPMAFADFLKLDLKPTIFVLNNNGYTVERLIHGPQAFYNEIPVWDYKQLTTVFGPGYSSKYYGPIRTCKELENLLADEKFGKVESFQLVELILGELDAPQAVRAVTAAIEAFNAKHAPSKEQDPKTTSAPGA